ncbi:MAG TPA: hypothetical protein VLT33_35985, partial [Labilithrix sp.]|nr:hypothetical protein [Labilithrix sp.]
QDGKSFLRYVHIQKAAAGDVGTKHVGTVWLDAGAAGALERTEICDAATKGTKTTGHYEQTAGAGTTLTLDLPDHQEKWTKQ